MTNNHSLTNNHSFINLSTVTFLQMIRLCVCECSPIHKVINNQCHQFVDHVMILNALSNESVMNF